MKRESISKVWIHVAAWLAFLAIPLFIIPPPGIKPHGIAIPPPEPARAVFFLSLNLLLICFFYLNYVVLIPNLWTKGRRSAYFIGILASFLALQILVLLMSKWFFMLFTPEGNFRMMYSMGFLASFILFGLAWASSSGIRLSMEWKKSEERRIESENAQLSAELSQLKSQLNPHFLFNTLNGIYILALSKNDAAPDAVMKLSHLLRYVMEDTNTNFVPLERDLEHLRHFVALHQMRLTAQTTIHFKVQGNVEGHSIAPLLLLPFVENAFKFGSSTREQSDIDITVTIEKNNLEFICTNYRHAHFADSTGIGISNTRRRLNLLYSDRHTLEISEADNLFAVKLSLKL